MIKKSTRPALRLWLYKRHTKSVLKSPARKPWKPWKHHLRRVLATKTELRPIFWNLRLLKGWDKWIKIFCKIAKLHEIYAINVDIFSRAQMKSYFSKSNFRRKNMELFLFVLFLDDVKKMRLFFKADFCKNLNYILSSL